MEEERTIHGARGFDRELGDQSILILDFHIEIVLPENRLRFLKDSSEATGQEPMIGIIRHPCLQGTMHRTANCAATVDECLLNAPYLGDMRVSLDQPTIWQNETKLVIG